MICELQLHPDCKDTLTAIIGYIVQRTSTVFRSKPVHAYHKAIKSKNSTIAMTPLARVTIVEGTVPEGLQGDLPAVQ
eukprot:4643430-Amphidinium_carterae.1